MSDERWLPNNRNWLVIEPSTNIPFQTMRGDIPKKLSELAKTFFTEAMSTEMEQNDKNIKDKLMDCGNDSKISDISFKSKIDSKMKDVVNNLRKGDSVIKSFTDKNRKKNVIQFIKSSVDSS